MECTLPVSQWHEDPTSWSQGSAKVLAAMLEAVPSSAPEDVPAAQPDKAITVEDDEHHAEVENFVVDLLKEHGAPRDTPTETNEGRQLKPGLAPRQAKFARDLMASADDVNPRSNLGQTFTRSLGGDKVRYEALSVKERAEFRANWAKAQLQELTVEHVHKEEWRLIDTTKGEYMSASKVLRKEGGQKGDVEPTKRLLAKCTQMGEPFLKWNTFTERYDFLYLKKESREDLVRAWSIFKKTNVDEAVPGDALQDKPMPTASTTPTPTRDPPRQPQTKAKATPKPKANATPKRANGNGDAEEDSPSKRGKDGMPSMKQVFAAAAKTKRNYSAATTAAAGLLEEIRRATTWSWACNESMLKGVLDSQARLSGVMDSFARQFIALELADMKRELELPDLLAKCNKFSLNLDACIDSLQQEVQMLIKMQRARK